MTSTGGLPQRPGVMRRISPLTVVAAIAVGMSAAAIFATVQLGSTASSITEPANEAGGPSRRLDRNRLQMRHKSSNKQRHRRGQEGEEPYDIYLGLAPKKDRRDLEEIFPVDESLSYSLSMSMTHAPSDVPTSSPSRAPTNAPTSSPSKGPSMAPTSPSPCGLDGIWMNSEDICQLTVTNGGDVEGVCDNYHQIEFVTNPVGTTGTLTGVICSSSDSDCSGIALSFDLIGFYNDEDCSFSAVSTTSDMTIKGKVSFHQQYMQIDSTQPGGGGTATTMSGRFTRKVQTHTPTSSPSRAPTSSPTISPTRTPTSSPFESKAMKEPLR